MHRRLGQRNPDAVSSASSRQEEENCQYFTAQGLGEPIHSLEVIGNWMNKLLHQYDMIQQQRAQNLRDIERFHPMQSARSIIDMLENEKVYPKEGAHLFARFSANTLSN